MFEFQYFDAQKRAKPLAKPRSYDCVARSELESLSFLIWGGHCTECAAPACYSTCDQYERRLDGRCSRFEFGCYRNTDYPSLRGYGAEIAFKKWGVLQCSGNSRVEPLWRVLLWERLYRRVAAVCDTLGRWVARLTGRRHWEWLSFALFERLVRRVNRLSKQAETAPHGFLLEVYNPQPADVVFLIFIQRFHRPGLPPIARIPPFRRRIVLPPGYSRHEFGIEHFAEVTEKSREFDISMRPEDESHQRLVILTADFVRYRKRPAAHLAGAATNSGVKCVVWDLDNTLWEGTLGENDDVRPRPEVIRWLRDLDQRGVILSIASKNDPASARAVLERAGIAGLFVHPKINWLPKSQNIRQIATQLNIGLDAILFIDDSPFERAEVAAIPGVWCADPGELPDLIGHPRLRGSSSEEARNRRAYYQLATLREAEQEEFGTDYIGFLRSCEMVLRVAPYSTRDAERVGELLQRTNQLNFSGSHYSRRDLPELLADLSLEGYVLRSEDRFGSYGTIGFALVRSQPPRIWVRDFMLSCRVQAKYIEQAFFAWLAERYDADELWVNFRPTARNQPARDTLTRLQFEWSEAHQAYYRKASGLECDFIAVDWQAARPRYAKLGR